MKVKKILLCILVALGLIIGTPSSSAGQDDGDNIACDLPSMFHCVFVITDPVTGQQTTYLVPFRFFINVPPL